MPALELLDRLFEPVTLRSFVDDYWPGRVLHAHGDLRRVEALRELPELNDVGPLFAAARDVILFYRDDGGKQVQAVLPAHYASRVYAAGMTALVTALHQSVPLLGELVRELEQQTGVPTGSCDAMVHLSRPSRGLNTHFDNQDVITLQIRGRKRWVVSDPDVVSPTVNYAEGSPVLGELRTYWNGRRKAAEPTAQTFVLEPGSALYVPRGYWHATEAIEESLSLSLGFSTLSWADLVAEHVRRRLITSPRWREPILGGFGLPDDSSTARARARLAELLPSLLDDLGPLVPDNLIPRAGKRVSTRPPR